MCIRDRNKSVKKQVLLDVKSNGSTIPMIFLVARNLPLNLLVRCDMLRQYSAIIDLSREKVSLISGDLV